jgi:hypothetical protein
MSTLMTAAAARHTLSTAGSAEYGAEIHQAAVADIICNSSRILQQYSPKLPILTHIEQPHFHPKN